MAKTELGTVRIIAGLWRGRKIHFPILPGVRPSADRLRETLFNWLMPYIYQARCLDLFTGSGALALEALSRGAASVVAVDQARLMTTALKNTAKLLNTADLSVIEATWPNVSAVRGMQFDLVFIDPPFNQNMVQSCCDWLIDQALLMDQALVYIEMEKNLALPIVSANWQLFRQTESQQVKALLYKVAETKSAT